MKKRLKKIFASVALAGTLVGGGIHYFRSAEPGKSPTADKLARFGWSAIGTPLYMRWQNNDRIERRQKLLETPEHQEALQKYLSEFDQFRGLDTPTLIKKVDEKIGNETKYIHDAWYWPDYWQSAPETIARKKGDCEDEAFLKREVLLYLGVPEENLMIVALSTGSYGNYVIDHYTLGVKTEKNKVSLLEGGYLKKDTDYFIVYGITDTHIYNYDEYLEWKARPPKQASIPAPNTQAIAQKKSFIPLGEI